MKKIDKKLLDSVTKEAQKSPRLRMNYNFHDHLDAKAQRLLNAMEPDSVFPIHRHRDTSETYIILRGRLLVRFYNDEKELINTVLLNPNEEVYGIHIPVGQWHNIEILESGTVIFESKDGPYLPLVSEDIMVID
ncbi:MAG: WbuC family cupin fold metalloprotein [Paludibacter sp.]|nr:WbuC family cupin fold metalloprotein [Paludibacter sp.]